MATRPIVETITTNPDVNNPKIEIVRFTTQSGSDYYKARKLAYIHGAFASNLTSDAKNIGCSWTEEANGQYRITLKTSEEATDGYLVIFGSK